MIVFWALYLIAMASVTVLASCALFSAAAGNTPPKSEVQSESAAVGGAVAILTGSPAAGKFAADTWYTLVAGLSFLCGQQYGKRRQVKKTQRAEAKTTKEPP